MLFSRNILFAPSSIDSYEASTFTGIRDAFEHYDLAYGKDKKLEQDLDYQITIAILAVQTASNILIESIVS